MHLDHRHEINYTIVRSMDEQLIYIYISSINKKRIGRLPLSVSIRRKARISERGEPNEKNSLTSNANIKP